MIGPQCRSGRWDSRGYVYGTGTQSICRRGAINVSNVKALMKKCYLRNFHMAPHFHILEYTLLRLDALIDTDIFKLIFHDKQ